MSRTRGGRRAPAQVMLDAAFTRATPDLFDTAIRDELTDLDAELAQELARAVDEYPKPSGPALTWPWVMLGDFVALVLAAALGLAVLLAEQPSPRTTSPALGHDLQVIGVFAGCQILLFHVLGLYRGGLRRLRPSGYSDASGVVTAAALGSLAALAITLGLERGGTWAPPDGYVIAILLVAVVVLTLAIRSALYQRIRLRHPTRVLIVGSGTIASSVRDYLDRDPGATVVGFVDDDPAPPTRVIGRTADLPSLCQELSVDRVLVSFSRTHPKDLTASLRQLQGVVPIGMVPRYFELLTWRSKVDDLCGLPIIDVAAPSLGRFDRTIKRSFDLSMSLFLLVVLSPLLVMVAVAVKLTSPGPVFFHQVRVGRQGKPFRLYKFRSMWRNADEVKERLRGDSVVQGPLFKIREDPRISPIGRWLRRTSLDELPQLLNVVAGQMSLVGPRPFVPAESEQIDGWATKRFEARPGLTGLWQVSGRNDLSYDDLRRLDYQYVASWSLGWDVKILWQTPGCVIKGRGAY